MLHGVRVGEGIYVGEITRFLLHWHSAKSKKGKHFLRPRKIACPSGGTSLLHIFQGPRNTQPSYTRGGGRLMVLNKVVPPETTGAEFTYAAV